MRNPVWRTIAGVVFLGGLAPFVAGVASAQTKKPIVGLIQMGRNPALSSDPNYIYKIPSNSLTDLTTMAANGVYFGGTVINVAWSDLQPDDKDHLNTATIDNALAAIRTYNSANPQYPLHAILRVYAGIDAPTWVQTQTGGSVTVYPKNSSAARLLAQFWTSTFQQLWQNLQNKLASGGVRLDGSTTPNYDAETLIVEISNSSCTSSDEEPFALDYFFTTISGATYSSITNLVNAGFSNSAYQACLASSPSDYSEWATTNVTFDVATLQQITSGPNAGTTLPTHSSDFTIGNTLTPSTGWAATYGHRLIFGDHGINAPLIAEPRALYALWQQDPSPSNPQMYPPASPATEFQTFIPVPVDLNDNVQWQGTIDEVVCHGSNAVELWNTSRYGGFAGPAGAVGTPTYTQLISWVNELNTSTLPMGSSCSSHNIRISSSASLSYNGTAPTIAAPVTNGISPIANVLVDTTSNAVTVTLPAPTAQNYVNGVLTSSTDIVPVGPGNTVPNPNTTCPNPPPNGQPCPNGPLVVVVDIAGKAGANNITITVADNSGILGNSGSYSKSPTQTISGGYGALILQVIADGTYYGTQIPRYTWKIIDQ